MTFREAQKEVDMPLSVMLNLSLHFQAVSMFFLITESMLRSSVSTARTTVF